MTRCCYLRRERGIVIEDDLVFLSRLHNNNRGEECIDMLVRA